MHYNLISFADLSEIYTSGPEELQTSVTCGSAEQLGAAKTSLGTIRAWPATDDTSGIENPYHLISEYPLALLTWPHDVEAPKPVIDAPEIADPLWAAASKRMEKFRPGPAPTGPVVFDLDN